MTGPVLGRVQRGAFALLAIFFVYATVVQFNDDDALFWIVIYGSAAAACTLVFAARSRRELPMIVGVAALAWSGVLLPTLIAEQSNTAAAFFDSEVAREVCGLWVVAVVMATAAWLSPPLSSRR